MSSVRHGLWASVGLLIFGWLTAAAADPVEPAALRQKQQAQQRARELARELVSSVLDMQLQQLEENGLTDRQIYRDVKSMRQNIDGLVEAEMLEVVSLLAQAQLSGRAEREKAFVAARAKIRQIVVRLSIERQNLLRRLKAAEIVAQVKRLIALESAALSATEALPQQPRPKQETQALETVEDQRDVKQLFLHLVEALADVRSWGGAVGAGAADGLRILKTAQVGQALDNAGQNLEAAQFAAAAACQREVIRGLNLLLEKLEETQGLIGTDREALLELVRELTRRQEALRTQTEKTNLNERTAEALVDQQSSLHKDLSRLGDALQAFPSAQPLAEQAKAAAYEATARLFDARQADALAQQTKVLGNLAEIEEQLRTAADADAADKTAQEYAQIVRALESARDELIPAQADQSRATKAAPTDRAAAKSAQEQVAARAAEAAKNQPLPQASAARLAEAEATAREAAQMLADTSQPQDAVKQATASAAGALERAVSEVESSLDDAQRKALGVKIGELARAAEALERAAAAQRDVAQAALEAAQAGGLPHEEARRLLAEQADIDAVARKTAEGVKDTAPSAAAMLHDAAQDTTSAQSQLAAASEKPGEASKSQAQEAAQSAASAAKKLAAAAADLRKQVGQSAQQLAELSRQQLKELSPVRQAVDVALAKAPQGLTERIEQLEQAAAKVREALAEQLRAAGNPQAADAMKLAQRIATAQAMQSAADRAAAELAAGKAQTPLDAATRQQQVADEASQIAEAAAAARDQVKAAQAQGQHDALHQALEQAQKAATDAAKATLDGDASNAQAARQSAKAALDQARDLALAEAAKAMQGPPGKPSAKAQDQVTRAAGEAVPLAAPSAPSAAQALEQAKSSSNEALKQIEGDNADQAAAAQAATTDHLKMAAAEIAKAQSALAQQQADQLAAQAMQAGQLAQQSVPVDAGATTALRGAQQAAELGAAKPRSAPMAAQAAQRSMERAAANLYAREQRVQRDLAVAEALAELANGQQLAAAEIASAAAELAQVAGTPSPPAGKSPAVGQGQPASSQPSSARQGAAQQAAAQRLTEAMQAFADAQRATGQGAEEVSGQAQVANLPIREALDIASGLARDAIAPGQPNGDLPTSSRQQDSPSNASGQPRRQASGSGQAPPRRQAQPESQGSSPSPGNSSSHAASQPSSAAQGGAPSPGAMGSRFVPSSPEVTAEMIAGPNALAQLSAAQASASSAQGQGQGRGPGQAQSQAQGQGHGPSQGEGQGQGQGQAAAQTATQGQPGAAAAGGAGGGSSQGGQPAENAPRLEFPLTPLGSTSRADSRTPNGAPSPADHRPDSGVENAPWFARLPADLREAIRAKSRRPAPRGYEERLKRYFESIER
jgi:hypothetical protein